MENQRQVSPSDMGMVMINQINQMVGTLNMAGQQLEAANKRIKELEEKLKVKTANAEKVEVE